MSDLRPYHAKCQVRYRCEKNEVAIPYSDHAVLVGDLWKCPACGDEIIIGWASQPWDAYANAPESEDRIKRIVRACAGAPGGYVALGAAEVEA